jgi:PEP-CTERM motif
MSISRFVSLAVSALAVLLLSTGGVEAGYVPLPSNLGTLTTPGNYTTVNDSTLTFTGYSSSTNNGVALAASSIGVSTIPGSSATGFELTGPIGAESGGATGSQNDIAISYMLTTTGPGFSTVALTANGATSGTGNAQVVEDVYTDSSKSTLLGQISTTAGTVYLNLQGSYTSLYVTKDIQYNTFDSAGMASFSIVDQTFLTGDAPQVVPEPASFAMLGLGVGMVGAFGLVRSRRRAAIA